MKKEMSDSQFGQDAWVLEQLDYKRNGYFVDVGAGTPIELSNTYILETQYGWSGILIEPYKPFFDQLVEVRSAICDNSCVYSDVQSINYIHTTGGYGNTLEPFRYKISANVQHSEQITTVTLTSLLQKYSAPTIIDYLDIDVEGAELDVLKSIDFTTYSFRTITVEDNRQKDQIMKLLHPHGYRLNKWVHENSYITKEI